MEIPSPCIGTCRIREVDQRCEGCERTIDEITGWTAMDRAAKSSLLEALAARRRQRQGSSTGHLRASTAVRPQ